MVAVQAFQYDERIKSMSLKIASFNVNSIKMRLPKVINWLEESKTDILLMQETKTLNENFPQNEFFHPWYFQIINFCNGLFDLSMKVYSRLVQWR